MRVFYRQRSGRPFRVAWALEELGLDYETVVLTTEECRGAQHLARHPLGRVPVLEFDDGTTLFESTAIVLTLAELYPDGGLTGPPGSRLRAEVYQWSIFAMTELERQALLARDGAPVDEDFRESNLESVRLALAAIGDRLADGPFLLGEQLTAADIVVVGVLAVVDFVGLLDLASATVLSYLRRLQQRPQYVRSRERTGSHLPG